MISTVSSRTVQLYLVVVALAALAVPAARHAFHHLLPLAGATRDAADGGWQGGVARLPAHVLHLREDGERIHNEQDTRELEYNG